MLILEARQVEDVAVDDDVEVIGLVMLGHLAGGEDATHGDEKGGLARLKGRKLLGGWKRSWRATDGLAQTKRSRDPTELRRKVRELRGWRRRKRRRAKGRRSAGGEMRLQLAIILPGSGSVPLDRRRLNHMPVATWCPMVGEGQPLMLAGLEGQTPKKNVKKKKAIVAWGAAKGRGPRRRPAEVQPLQRVRARRGWNPGGG